LLTCPLAGTHGASAAETVGFESHVKDKEQLLLSVMNVRHLWSKVVTISLLYCCMLMGCKPTARDFIVESGRTFEPYGTGDVHVAKAALLAEERVIAKYEAAGTPGYDFHHAYLVTYGRLCAVHLHLGNTNQAREYFERAIAHRSRKRSSPTGEVTMESLLQSISRLDAEINPKWRQVR
jgi:hypothetical protein